VFQTFMNAYASAIEPHTGFLGPRASENFSMSMRLSLEGIGAVLQRDDEFTVVRQVVKGGPIDKLGSIKVGDRIVAVGSAKDKMQDVVGWRLDYVVDLIRGKKGTTVVLDVIPAEAGVDSKPVTIAVVRDEVKLEEQAAKKSVIEVPDGDYTRKIGVIALPTFYHDFEGRRRGDPAYRSSTRDVAKLLRELKTEGVEGVVVDLRDNGGGSLTEATQLSGLFIDRGPVVQVRDAQGRVSVESDTEAGVEWDGPLAVLVNRSSASASEIFAAALQDYGRALIIGETTFGKGTVQNLVDLDNVAQNEEPQFGQLKLTIAQFFRINGGSTQHRGVVPDIAFPATWDPKEYGESALDNALPWTSITPADYAGAGNFRELTPALAQRHEARVAKNREFQWWLEDLAEYRKMRNATELSLLESARKAERDAQEQRRKAREAEREAAGIKTARKDEPSIDDGLDAAEKAREALAEAEKEEDDAPDVLLTEAAAILSDAITMLAGDHALAQRVRAFTLADNRRVSTDMADLAARGAASSKSNGQ
jgi:carboxyl-terminal processing protease